MTRNTESSKILVTCAKGIAPYLKNEISTLGFPVLEEKTLGIFTQGPFNDTIDLNMQLRTGLRVLFQIDEFSAQTPEELYDRLIKINWEDYIHKDGYISVTSSVSTDSIKDSRFANLKCKDAIVDRIQQECGSRPDSGPDRNKAVIFLYWKDNNCAVFLDTTGEPLSKRGYRKIPMKAPMQETLAAAVILATGWNGNGPFINPMCGSGTLAIEAAFIAINKAPGLLRHNYGFMHFKQYDKEHYQSVRRALRSQIKKSPDFDILASDIDPGAVSAAKKNANTAGVEHLINFRVCDFTATPAPEQEGGIIVINPEYGFRLNEEKRLAGVYKGIGDFFKNKCTNYKGYIFTGNLSLAKKVGLKTSRRLIFHNGPIECRLLEYELYSGTKKLYKTEKDGP